MSFLLFLQFSKKITLFELWRFWSKYYNLYLSWSTKMTRFKIKQFLLQSSTKLSLL